MRCPTLKDLPPAPPEKMGWPWTEESVPLADMRKDGSPWPRVTIVTPSYNQGQYLEETMRSVLLQGYPDLEYIVVDGGSTDGSVDVIRKYEKWIAHWVSEKDQGQSDAINKGWKIGTGEITAWINADDTYCPEAFEVVGRIFGEDDNVVLVSGAGNRFDAEGRLLSGTMSSPGVDPYILLRCDGRVPPQPSVFLKRRVLEQVGLLDPHLYHVMDWELWIRIGFHYKPRQLRTTAAVLSNFRDYPGTKTNTGLKMPCQELRRVLTSIFDKNKGDQRLSRIEKSCFSATHHIQAVRARDQGETIGALSSLFRAWLLAPFNHNPAKDLFLLFSILLGRRKRTEIIKKLNILTSRKN